MKANLDQICLTATKFPTSQLPETFVHTSCQQLFADTYHIRYVADGQVAGKPGPSPVAELYGVTHKSLFSYPCVQVARQSLYKPCGCANDP